MYLKYILFALVVLCVSCNQPIESQQPNETVSGVLIPTPGSQAITEIKGINIFGYGYIMLGSSISDVNLAKFPTHFEEETANRVYGVYRSERIGITDLPFFDKMSVEMRNKLTNIVVSGRASDVFGHSIVGLEFYDDKLDTIHIGFQPPFGTTVGNITAFVQEMRQAIKSYYDPRLIILDKFYGDEGYSLEANAGCLMLVDEANDLNCLMFVWKKTSAYIDIHFGQTFSSRELLKEKLKERAENQEDRGAG